MQTLLQSANGTNFHDDWVELLFLPVGRFDQSLAVRHALTQTLIESIQVPDVERSVDYLYSVQRLVHREDRKL